MGFSVGTIGGTLLGTAIGGPGGAAVGGKLGSVIEGFFDDGGSKGPLGVEITSSNPLAPGELQMRQVFQNATPGEMAELKAAWTAANPPGRQPLFEEAIMHPAYFGWAAWGGSDNRVNTTTGQVLHNVTRRLLDKYAGGDYQLALPPAKTSVLDQVIERAKSEAAALPGRIAGAAIEEVNRGVNTIAQPVVEDRASRAIMDALPFVVLGVAIVLGVMFLRKAG